MPDYLEPLFKRNRERSARLDSFFNKPPPEPDWEDEGFQGWLQGVLGRLRGRFEERTGRLRQVGEFMGRVPVEEPRPGASTGAQAGARLRGLLGQPIPEGLPSILPQPVTRAAGAFGKFVGEAEARRAAEAAEAYRGVTGLPPGFAHPSEVQKERLAQAQEQVAGTRAKELEESTFSEPGTVGSYLERQAAGVLDIAQFVPGGVLAGVAKKGAQSAKLAGKVAKGAEEAVAAFKVGDKITDGLVNAEIIAQGALKMGKTDVPGYKVKILSGKQAGKESFIGARDAKLVEAVPPVAEGAKAVPKAPAKPVAPKAEGPPIPPEKPPVAMGAGEIPPTKPPETAVGAMPEPKVPRGKPAPVEPIAATTEGMDLPNQLRATHREVLADVETVRQSIINKTDINSRLIRSILKDTERQLAKANQTLKQMETGGKASDEAITALRDRIAQNKALYQAATQGKGELKTTLVDYIKTVLPPAERGKMLASVKNMATEKGLAKAIDKVNNIAEIVEQRKLVSDVYKELSKTKPTKTVTGILQGKFTPEAQKQLDEIRSMVNTSREESQAQILKNVEAYNNGTLAYDDMIIQNERLRYAGIKEMPSGELQNLLEEIQDIKSGARASRIEEAIADKQRIQSIRDEVKNVVTGGEGLKPGTASLPPEQLKPKVTWREKITNWQYGWDNLLDKLSKLHKISEPFKSPLSKFGSVVHTARSAQYAGESKALASVQNMLKQAFNPKNRSALNRLLNAQRNEKVVLGKFTNGAGEAIDLNLTKGEMMSLYNQLKDETLDGTFREGMKWTDEMMEAVRNGLTAEEKTYADNVMAFFKDYYDEINEVYRKVYHVDLPRHENYFPAFRERDTDIPELIRLMEEANRYNSVAAQSLKARVANIRPLKFLDINDVLMNHITQMEHFKAWAEPMRDIRRVFNDREVRTAIKQYHGDDIMKTLEGFINDMARDGVDRAKVNRTVDMLRKNFTLAVLGVKPFIGVKQLPAVFAYAGGMPVGDFAKGVASFWRDPIRNYRTLINKSPYFKNRFGEGFERDIKFAMEKGTARRLSGTGNFKDYLMSLIRYGDRMAAAPGGWAEYQRVLKTGASEVKAMQSAEVLAKRLQASSELETLSSIQRAGSWGKLFTMFQTEPNKYFRLVADNVRNIQHGRGSRADAIKNLIVGWVVLPSVFQWITDGFEVEPTHQARAVVLGPLNNLLVIGGMLQSIEGWLTDQPYDYQASPVFASMDDLRNAVTKTAKMIQAGIDPTKDVKIEDVIGSIEYYAKFAGELTGVPTPYGIQVERALREGKPAGLIFPASITGQEKESPVIAGLRSEWGEDIGKFLRIPTDPLEIKAKKIDSREDTRKKNPDLDAKLFITNQVSSVLTNEAAEKVFRLAKEKGIDPANIKGISKTQESLAKMKELGLENPRITPTEALTTSLAGGTYQPAPTGGGGGRVSLSFPRAGGTSRTPARRSLFAQRLGRGTVRSRRNPKAKRTSRFWALVGNR